MFEEDKGFVRILKNGEVIKEEITLGLEGDLYVEVENNLKEGDSVIVQINGDT